MASQDTSGSIPHNDAANSEQVADEHELLDVQESASTNQDATLLTSTQAEGAYPTPTTTSSVAKRLRRVAATPSKVAADQREIGLTPASPEEILPVATKGSSSSPGTQQRQRVRHPLKAGWAAFRRWRLQRPFWGSILMLLASLLMLYGPVSLLGVMFLPGSAVPIALTVGTLMLVMALAQLFVPAHALITGLIGIVLSIASLVTGSFGGLGIGLILGILGSAQGVAWKANARPFPTKRSSAQKRGRPTKSSTKKRRAGVEAP